MARRFKMVAVMVGILAFAGTVSAHHGAASFDTGKTITVTGTVTEFIWTNPHVLIKVDAKGDSAEAVHWVLEAWNPVTQAGRGWSKNTFKPGDEVSMEITPAKNDKPIGEVRGRIVINGKEFKQLN
jgi:hypothetical protein